MPQLEHIEAIERRLWSAADTLRANSRHASNEYFLPVMGLVFLRHAYSRYLAVRDAVTAGLPTRGGRKRTVTRAAEACNGRNVTRTRNAADEARRAAVEQLRRVRYFWRQARWLTERFPDGNCATCRGSSSSSTAPTSRLTAGA